MNLVIPIGSKSRFFSAEEYGYPKSLIEINQIPMIQHVVENLTKDINFKNIIFIIRREESDYFHMDSTLRLISPIDPAIVKLNYETSGALCSVLLSIDQIDNQMPLIISNSDQVFDGGVAEYVKKFLIDKFDAACITFNSVHPRWSYVLADGNRVIESAEKRPISKHAIAGFYMYRNASEFIERAIQAIKFGPEKDGKYYISSVFNQYILSNKEVGMYVVKNSEYHTFYTPQKINEYEKYSR